MKKEEFDSQIWTGGMKAIVLNSILLVDEYDVISVDFENKSVLLEVDSIEIDFSYLEIEIA